MRSIIIKITILILSTFLVGFIQKDYIKITNKILQKLMLENNGNCIDNPGCCSIDGDSQMGVLVANIKFGTSKYYVRNDSIVLIGAILSPEGDGEKDFMIYRVKRQGNLFCFEYDSPIAKTNDKGLFKFSLRKLQKEDYLLFYKKNYTHDIVHIGRCDSLKK